MSSDSMVVVEHLSKVYALYDTPLDRLKQGLHLHPKRRAREIHAVRDLTFDVRGGETFAIMGRNGSGKSTVLEVIAGTLRPTSGMVRVNGRIAALLELGAGFHRDLTGRENVYISGAVMGLSHAEVDERFSSIVRFAELTDHIDRPVRTYSSGMFVRLAFAVAISVDPEILIVDEALSVGDEAFQRKCFARIDEIRGRGATVLFVSHSASTILRICDRAMLIDRGERLLIADPKTVASRYHQLIFAGPSRSEEVRQQILELDRREEAKVEAGPVHEPPQALEEEHHDPEMRPKSTLFYVPRGASISDVRIINEAGEQSNVLRRGGIYYYEYHVRFQESGRQLRFGMLIKTVNGTELGGLTSHPAEAPMQEIEAGRTVRVRLPFCARLAPGIYFTNAGVLGTIQGHEEFLHRIVDALMIRVVPESAARVTVATDFSTREESSVETLSEARANVSALAAER